MCSGDPCLAQLAGLAILPQLPTRVGKRQGMLRGMLRRLWSIQQPNALLQSRGTGQPAGRSQPQVPRLSLALALMSEWGWQRGSLPSPPGTPTSPDGALCCSAAAPALLSPGELAEGMPAFILPSSFLHRDTLSGCSKPGCWASEQDEPLEEWQLAPLLRGDGARGPGHPGEQRAVGWVCAHSPASVHPWLGGCNGCVWGEHAMPASSQSRGGTGASLGEVPSGEPRGVSSPPTSVLPPSLLPSLPPLGEGHPAPRQMT